MKFFLSAGIVVAALGVLSAAHAQSRSQGAPLSIHCAAPATHTSTLNYYVATNGSAQGDGSQSHPFQTIDQARACVRSLGIAQNAALFSGTIVTVLIAPGTYQISAPIDFEESDSGLVKTPILYTSADPSHPAVISGGVPITSLSSGGWKKRTGPGNYWQIVLDATNKAYFENMWVGEARATRSRLSSNLGAIGSYYRIAQTVTVPTPATNCASANNNPPYKCFDRFLYALKPIGSDPNDPRVLHPEQWGNVAPCSANLNFADDVQILVFEQFSTSKLHVKCYDNTTSPTQGTIYLTGPTAIPQGANISEAGFITGNRLIIENVKNALSCCGEWFLDRGPSGASAAWTLTYAAGPGVSPATQQIIVPQARQLIIASQLQYVTFKDLVFEYDNYTLTTCDANGHQCGYKSSELEPDWPSALSFQNSQNIVLNGVTVRHTSGGGVDFTPCIKATDSEGNPVSPIWCRYFPATPITANIQIAGSTFYDLGAHGIRIGQNSRGPLDNLFNDTNVPQKVWAWNNVVEGYGRIIPSAFGIGQGVGHDNTYDHNEVYDGYHVGISISHGGDVNAAPIGMGNASNTISNNLVHDIEKGTMNDGGTIRIEAGNYAFTASGNVISGNVIHDTIDASVLDTGQYGRRGYGGDGIYLDNSTGKVLVTNNLVYRVSDYAVYSPHGPAYIQGQTNSGPNGPANIIKNNILAYARRGMIAVHDPYIAQPGPTYRPGQAFIVTANLMYFDRDETMQPDFYVHSGCVFPGFQFLPAGNGPLPYTDFQKFASNLYYRRAADGGDGHFELDSNAIRVATFTNKAAPGVGDPCGPERRDLKMNKDIFVSKQPLNTWQDAYNEDWGSIIKDPLFVGAVYGTDDYRLKSGSPASSVGFVAFPLSAGRPGNPPEPPVVPDTIPTATLNPATDF